MTHPHLLLNMTTLIPSPQSCFINRSVKDSYWPAQRTPTLSRPHWWKSIRLIKTPSFTAVTLLGCEFSLLVPAFYSMRHRSPRTKSCRTVNEGPLKQSLYPNSPRAPRDTSIMSNTNPIPHPGETPAVNGTSTQQPSAEPIMPIAIVGMACRFPGDASNVKGLWEMCCSGESAWSEFPKDRMNGAHYWHPNTSKHGSVSNSALRNEKLSHRNRSSTQKGRTS